MNRCISEYDDQSQLGKLTLEKLNEGNWNYEKFKKESVQYLTA